MGAWLSRMTILENDTDQVLEIQECPENGNCFPVVTLQPGEKKAIRANKFQQHCFDSLLCRSIKVIVAPGIEAPRMFLLNPEEFRCYGGLIFRLDEDQKLVFQPSMESGFRKIRVVRAAVRLNKKITGCKRFMNS